MVWPFTKSQHQRNIEFKQRQRRERIEALPEYRKPLTGQEQSLLSKNVESVVKQISAGELKSVDVIKAYGKAALAAHEKTNCLTEIMIRDAEKWAKSANLKGPLAGFPVSLKDPFYVAGYDSTAGYSALVGRIPREDGTTVRILRKLGAVPYVKTNVPITMMAIDGCNDLFGRTVNPWKSTHAPGGSSQGEGALIALGGSRIGLGSDIGGSVRVPAAWSGIYSLRFSSYRFPFDGDIHNDDGFEGVPAVVSPMARSLKDLKYFSDAVMGSEPWNEDYHLVNQRWRTDAKLPSKPRVGVLRLKNYMPLTPAVERALSTTADALKKQGYEVFDFDLPDPAIDYDWTTFRLYHGDGYESFVEHFLSGETGDPYMEAHRRYTWWPKCLRRIAEFFLRLFGFKDQAFRLHNMSPLTVSEYHKVAGRRQELRRHVFDKWKAEKVDFLITAAHPSPALPNQTPPLSFYTILYTSLWNLLDYPAGIVPVGRVDKAVDALPKAFSTKKLNHPSKITFDSYDAEEMDGLPLAVQVVTQRYHDEETLEAMKLVEDALHDIGIYYK